jgi:hypothetical protein
MKSPRSFLSAVSLFLILFMGISKKAGGSGGEGPNPMTASRMGNSRMRHESTNRRRASGKNRAHVPSCDTVVIVSSEGGLDWLGRCVAIILSLPHVPLSPNRSLSHAPQPLPAEHGEDQRGIALSFSSLLYSRLLSETSRPSRRGRYCRRTC